MQYSPLEFNRIVHDLGDIADSLHELGQAMRMFLKIEDFRKK